MKKHLFLCILMLLIGCGADYKFKKCEKMEDDEAYLEAANLYSRIAQEHQDRAAEALYKYAELYRLYLLFYPEAIEKYMMVYELYPGQTQWADKAKRSIIDCPNYFPLGDGNKWIEVDSATGGNNMKEVRNCSIKKSDSGGEGNNYYIDKSVYAGKTFVSEISGRAYYTKSNLEVREYSNRKKSDFQVLLKFPFEEGTSWTGTTGGRKIYYFIEKVNVNCKVKAGFFKGCLKVRKKFGDSKSVTYTYYAPMIGKVLTTTKSLGSAKETRVTELSSFIIPEQ